MRVNSNSLFAAMSCRMTVNSNNIATILARCQDQFGTWL